MKDAPIFVNSLFRSASTYIYNAFQRAESEKYYCFQEPLHEATWLNRNTPDGLSIDGTSDTQKSLRHPEMKRGYYDSMIETHDVWRDLIRDDFGYDKAFETEDVADEVKFFKALAKASTARPVFQECRLSWRAGALKAKLDGIYIHLWRNPRDQWWSYKTTPYFGAATHLIASAEKRPQLVQWALDVADIPIIPPGPTDERLELAKLAPAAPEASYRLHYALWLESQLHLRASADIEISIDRLSADEPYRQTVVSELEMHKISGLDFSDCHIVRAEFSKDECEFFEHIEKSVEAHAQEFGYDQGALDIAVARKNVGHIKMRRRSAINEKYAKDAARARQITLGVEYEATKQRQAAMTAGGSLLAMDSALTTVQVKLEHEYEKRFTIQAVEIARLNHACVDRDAALEVANNHIVEANKDVARIAENYETALSHARVQSTRDQNQISRLITEMQAARENWAERADHYEKALHHYRHHSVQNERAIVALNQTVSEKVERVNALEQSTSWRITAPVRFVSKTFSFRNWLSFTKRLGRKILEKGLGVVRATPGASRALWKVTSLIPPLNRKLQHFTSVRGIHLAGAPEAGDQIAQEEAAPAHGSVIDPALADSLRHYVQTSYGAAALSRQGG